MRREPERTCIGCRQVRPRGALVRLVRRPDGAILVDVAGAAPGRGAYVCPAAACVEDALKRGRLDRAFRSGGGDASRVRELLNDLMAATRGR